MNIVARFLGAHVLCPSSPYSHIFGFGVLGGISLVQNIWASHQAEVVALNDAIGSAAQSVMAIIATAVEASVWYSERLQEFMDTRSSMKEFGGKLKETTKTVQKMGPTDYQGANICSDLVGYLKDFGTMEAAMRDGATAELGKALSSTITAYWEWFKKHHREHTQENMQKLAGYQQVLNEASIAFPMDAIINDISDEAAMQMQLMHVNVKKHGLENHIAEWECSATEFAGEGAELKLKQLHDAMMSTKGLRYSEKDDFYAKVVAVIDSLLACGFNRIDSPLTGWVARVVPEMMKLLEKEPLDIKHRCWVMEAAHQLAQLKSTLTEAGDKPEQIFSLSEGMEKAQATQRAAARLSHAISEAKKAAKIEGHIGTAEEQVQISQKLAKAVFDYNFAQAAEKVNLALGKLEPVCRGRADSKYWAEGMEYASLEELLAMGGDTILNVDEEALSNIQNEAAQAICVGEVCVCGVVCGTLG